MKHLNVIWIQNHCIVFYNGHTTPKATTKSLMTEKKKKKRKKEKKKGHQLETLICIIV